VFEDAQLIATLPRLRRYARALLPRNPDAVQDLVQATVLRALERRALYRPDSNLRAWLFAIMHNIYVDLVRNAVLTTNRNVPLDEALMVPAPGSDQEAAVWMGEVIAAIDELPPHHRDVVLMSSAGSAVRSEMTKALDIPEGTAASRLFRARAALRERLL
jgi:RNA polymerase sigma-70 factor (ECF subfamily)